MVRPAASMRREIMRDRAWTDGDDSCPLTPCPAFAKASAGRPLPDLSSEARQREGGARGSSCGIAERRAAAVTPEQSAASHALTIAPLPGGEGVPVAARNPRRGGHAEQSAASHALTPPLSRRKREFLWRRGRPWPLRRGSIPNISATSAYRKEAGIQLGQIGLGFSRPPARAGFFEVFHEEEALVVGHPGGDRHRGGVRSRPGAGKDRSEGRGKPVPAREG